MFLANHYWHYELAYSYINIPIYQMIVNKFAKLIN